MTSPRLHRDAMNPSSTKRRKMDSEESRISVEQIVRQFSALSDISNSSKESNQNNLRRSNASEDFDDVTKRDVFSRRHLVKMIQNDDGDVVDLSAAFDNIVRPKSTLSIPTLSISISIQVISCLLLPFIIKYICNCLHWGLTSNWSLLKTNNFVISLTILQNLIIFWNAKIALPSLWMNPGWLLSKFPKSHLAIHPFHRITIVSVSRGFAD